MEIGGAYFLPPTRTTLRNQASSLKIHLLPAIERL